MSAVNSLIDRAFQLPTTDGDGIESRSSVSDGPQVRISNMPELRLQAKEICEGVDLNEWRFLPYAEENEGILESSSQAGSYCGAAHLNAITHNLAIARQFCQLEIDAEYIFVENIIMATYGELSRLQSHPELFPSEDIREEFWEEVLIKCNRLNSVILRQKGRDDAHKIFRAGWLDFKADMRTPGWDMQRKPWEQFFHNRAPGADADLSTFAEEGSLQIIPLAAARILIANIDEHKAIVRDIEAQRKDLRPNAPSSGNNLNSNNLANSPYGHLRSHKSSLDLCKPTRAGPMDISRRADLRNNLETLNLDFATLNRRRFPLRLGRWNYVWVVVHDRPNYGVDSKQRNEIEKEMMSIFD